MRDALSLLDQLIAFGGGNVNEANARAMLGTIDRGHVGRWSRRCRAAMARRCWAKCGIRSRCAGLRSGAGGTGGVPAAYCHRANRARGRAEDEEFDAADADALAQAHFARGCAALLSDRARRPPRFEHGARASFGIRNDACCACWRFGPRRASQARTGRRRTAAGNGQGPARLRRRNAGAVTQRPAPQIAGAAVAPATSIDAGNWPAVVEAAGLSGMVRQFALNCVPAGFEHDVLTLKTRSSGGGSAHASIEDKLMQVCRSISGATFA
jgi:DNA polymerase-3 subunit gamma/tau